MKKQGKIRFIMRTLSVLLLSSLFLLPIYLFQAEAAPSLPWLTESGSEEPYKLLLSDIKRARRGELSETCPRDGKCKGGDWNPHFYYITSTVDRWVKQPNCDMTKICYVIKADCNWCSEEFLKWNKPEGSKNQANCCKDISHIDFPTPSKGCVEPSSWTTNNTGSKWEFLRNENYLKYDGSQNVDTGYYKYCMDFEGDIAVVASDKSSIGVRIKAGNHIQEFDENFGHTPYLVPSTDTSGCKPCVTTTTTVPVTTTTVPVTTTTVPVTTTTVPVTTTTVPVTTTTVPVTTTTVPVTSTNVPVSTTTRSVTSSHTQSASNVPTTSEGPDCEKDPWDPRCGHHSGSGMPPTSILIPTTTEGTTMSISARVSSRTAWPTATTVSPSTSSHAGKNQQYNGSDRTTVSVTIAIVAVAVNILL